MHTIAHGRACMKDISKCNDKLYGSHTIMKLINDSLKRINQSINQSINRSIDRSIDQKINKSTHPVVSLHDKQNRSFHGDISMKLI